MSSAEQAPLLDRVDLAITLRKAGLHVDFEDWDGLTDQQVVPLIKFMHYDDLVTIKEVTNGENYEV